MNLSVCLKSLTEQSKTAVTTGLLRNCEKQPVYHGAATMPGSKLPQYGKQPRNRTAGILILSLKPIRYVVTRKVQKPYT